MLLVSRQSQQVALSAVYVVDQVECQWYSQKPAKREQVAMQCRLWRALAEHALKDRNFDMAEKSFVRCAEYQVRLWGRAFRMQL